jgi:hypothetical protein
MHIDETDNNEWLKKIQELYERLGIEPAFGGASFHCPHYEECSKHCEIRDKFHTGTWPYVGAEYGQAIIKGHRAKILFVAMERGGKFDPSEVPTLKHTQDDFRNTAEKRKNPHMGGVAAIMKHLVDEADPLSSDPLSYCRQFALTNAVKCVEYTDRMDSGSTPTMIRKCRSHLTEEIDLLKPDLIITQGVHPRETVMKVLRPQREVREFKDESGRKKARILVAGSRLLFTTPHPAARLKGLKWKIGVLPGFLDDAVRLVRDEFAAMSAGS